MPGRGAGGWDWWVGGWEGPGAGSGWGPGSQLEGEAGTALLMCGV